MSKWCSRPMSVVLAVICLSVILLSLETDAQSTVDDQTTQCGASTSDEIVNMIKLIALNQHENAKNVKDEIKDVKRLLVSNPAEFEPVELSKQVLVSALVCKYRYYVASHGDSDVMRSSYIIFRPISILMVHVKKQLVRCVCVCVCVCVSDNNQFTFDPSRLFGKLVQPDAI